MEENSQKKLVENTILRRLFRILNMPTSDLPQIDPENQDINCESCLQKAE